MFDDDDFEDYFLEEEDTDDICRLSEPREARRYDSAGRRTISFVETDYIINGDDGDGDRRRLRMDAAAVEAADEAGEREDNNAPLQGCMSGWFLGLAVFALLLIGLIGYFRYMSPTVVDATAVVRVVKIERRGVVFKTYEADIVEPQQLADTAGVYTHPRSLSVADGAVARILREAKNSGRPVEIGYEVYSATLPWRGESKVVVTWAR